jgi:hypothetical protein
MTVAAAGGGGEKQAEPAQDDGCWFRGPEPRVLFAEKEA